jgi:hypothetical protein
MPTKLPRLVITETDEVARALDDAAARWPEDRDRRAKLVLHLLNEGHRALVEADARVLAGRLEALARTSGLLTGVYDTDYLSRLREEWPE